ncbi:MAG: DUF2185 domain-containing protein [Deltaproteobacteria bacterium]|nr:DUF2185 domain-containing protein [Deltaproteobacteria bacterium]
MRSLILTLAAVLSLAAAPGAKKKVYKLKPAQMKVLAPNKGSCIATDRITVDGAKVGYMYREKPDLDHDSGWRFFAGDESDAYANDATKLARYDVNTVANYDPEIIPLLGAPLGSKFGRDPKTKKFVAEK